VIRHLLAFTVVTSVTACTANPAQPVGPAAIEEAKRAVPAASPAPTPAGLTDLTGVWAIAATGKSLPAGPVTGCDRQQVLVLQQQGERLTGYRTWFGYVGELPLESDSELLQGDITGSQNVRLQGTSAAFDGTTHDVLYEFRFDLTTLHLQGKRNGEAFEAAQLLCPQLGRPEFSPRNPQIRP
jgi:hypothetical protein